MTINLSQDLEHSIEAIVHSGRFTSVDEAMAEAARRLIRDLGHLHQSNLPINAEELGPDPILGCMADHAELMDEIVAEAYRQRGVETWREIDL